MLSRVAEAIYWMSRYLERAENVARFINVNNQMMLDMPTGEEAQWMPLVNATGDDKVFAGRYGLPTRERVLKFLMFDPQNANSILMAVSNARENARSVREHITSEMWQQLNTFYLMLREAAAAARHIEEPSDLLQDIIRASQTFLGITHSSMTHGEGWHFARLGRLIERADKTSRILDVKYFVLLPSVSDVGTVYDDIQWAAVLRSASGFEMYRKRHGRIDPARIVDYLLLDREFPRAVRYCVSEADNTLRAISGTPRGTFRNRAEQRLGQFRAELEYTQVEDILRAGLHEFIDTMQVRLNTVGDAIFETFFAIRPVGVQPE